MFLMGNISGASGSGYISSIFRQGMSFGSRAHLFASAASVETDSDLGDARAMRIQGSSKPVFGLTMGVVYRYCQLACYLHHIGNELARYW